MMQKVEIEATQQKSTPELLELGLYAVNRVMSMMPDQESKLAIFKETLSSLKNETQHHEIATLLENTKNFITECLTIPQELFSAEEHQVSQLVEKLSDYHRSSKALLLQF